jgi:hypothetical protein
MLGAAGMSLAAAAGRVGSVAELPVAATGGTAGAWLVSPAPG